MKIQGIEVLEVTRNGKTYRIPYEGYKVGLTMETVVSCIGATLEHLDEILYSDPDNVPAQAAKWMLEEAFNKIAAGEPVNPYGIELTPIEDHQYFDHGPNSK